MPPQDPLSRNELKALVGISDDTMTHWLAERVLRGETLRPGRGKKAKYPYFEANIAALMVQLKRFGAKSETLRGVGAIYRDAVAWGGELGLTFETALILQVYVEGTANGAKDPASIEISDTLRSILTLRKAEPTLERLQSLQRAVRDIDQVAYARHSAAFLEIMAQPMGLAAPYPTYFWRTADGWKRGNGPQGQARASADGEHTLIAIDVVGILYSVWNRP